jgi:hypothetical protein
MATQSWQDILSNIQNIPSGSYGAGKSFTPASSTPATQASTSVKSNIGNTSSSGYWTDGAVVNGVRGTGQFIPGMSQAVVDSATTTKMAPTNFSTTIPDTLPSGAITPTNTSKNLTATVDEDRNRLMGYLKPTEPETKAIDELATIRAEGAKVYSAKAAAIDALEQNPSGMNADQLEAEKQRIGAIYDRQLDSLALREKGVAQTVNSYQQQRSGQLDTERVIQSYESTKATGARAAQDDFMGFVNAFSGSPQVQTDIEAYKNTGNISEGLKPILAQAQAAGYSPIEAMSLIQYQTDKVRKEEAAAALAQQKLLAAGDSQTKAQNLTATIQSVNSIASSLINQGVSPGSVEYANAIAQATAGSQTGLSATEVSGYATMANIGSQLLGLKDSITAVGKSSDISNIINSYAGKTVSSMTSPKVAELTAKINAIASPIARTLFGERGVLTDTDIKRVMSTMPDAKAPAIMDALYTELIKNVRQAAINKVSLDASTGRNVSGVTPYINQLVNDLQSVTPTSGTTSSGIKYKII